MEKRNNTRVYANIVLPQKWFLSNKKAFILRDNHEKIILQLLFLLLVF